MRFRPPESLEELKEEYFATQQHEKCAQKYVGLSGVEDCLYLDVYTRQTDEPLPVIVSNI